MEYEVFMNDLLEKFKHLEEKYKVKLDAISVFRTSIEFGDVYFSDMYDFLNEEFDNITKEFDMIMLQSAEKVSAEIKKEIEEKYGRSNR